MRTALLASLLVHVLGVLLTRPLASALAEPVDRWAGKSAELPASPLFDVESSSEPSPAVEAPSPATAPPAAATPEVVTASNAAVGAPSPPKPPKRAIRPTPRSTSETTPDAAPSAEASSAPSRPPSPPAPKAKHAGHGGAEGGDFGAEGAPSPRDLGYAFTRAIPPANDGDMGWSSAPLGSAGKLELTIHIDDGGHITSAEPRGVARPEALVRLVRRTMPLLRAGTFEVRRGTVAEGTELVELSAVVEEAKPDSDKLAFKPTRGGGTAGFLTPDGQRWVVVNLRVVRVEAK